MALTILKTGDAPSGGRAEHRTMGTPRPCSCFRRLRVQGITRFRESSRVPSTSRNTIE